MGNVDKIGSLRVVDYREYDESNSGFVIEQFGYWNCNEPEWAIPAWDEIHDCLAGPFLTAAAAQAEVDAYERGVRAFHASEA